jgi:hypothetical protein
MRANPIALRALISAPRAWRHSARNRPTDIGETTREES